MKTPKISIVIPSYNKAKYIEQTLSSIVAQKYSNLEVIIQDGGSTDGTLKTIKRYAKKYPQIFSFVSKKDKGQTDAINKGLRKAKGEILTYINADDVYERGALKKVGDCFANNPDILWLAGRGKVIDEKGREISKPVTSYKNMLLSINSYTFLLTVNYLMQPSVFWSRKAKGIFEGVDRHVMEYALWLKLGKIQMPKIVNHYLTGFRMTEDIASVVSFKKILAKDLQIVKKYTRNGFILFFHRLHNYIRELIGKKSLF